MKKFTYATLGAISMAILAGCAAPSIELLPYRRPNLYQRVPYEIRPVFPAAIRNIADKTAWNFGAEPTNPTKRPELGSV